MKNKWLFYCLHLTFWAFTSWLIVASFSITEHMVNVDDGVVSDIITRSDELIWFFGIGQPFFAVYFYMQLFLTKRLVKLGKIKKLLLKTILLIVLFYCIYFAVVYFFFIDQLHILWFPSLWYGIFIFYIIIAVAFGFIYAWSYNEKIRRQLEISTKEVELNLLRAQLHPHFLFNTMNNLLAMVDQEQNPKLTKSIDTLSSLLRYVVYENQQPKVSIAKEIQFISDFADLHLLRYEENEVDFKITIIGDYNLQMVEMSILLSFVENAFKHGVQLETTSFIHIAIDLTNSKEVNFNITNSIHPQKMLLEKGGYGLQATKDRLKLAYPNSHQLIIEEKKNQYSINLKLNTNESINN